ncbi:MAG: tRNA pseudouridine(54/55) synthase Pus10 [Candidatus Thermoplasmatota archaeon]|nr:tRNA pseudouridine(54/55) synthase Pus10 [Candidatus Thermoplasmatota archaeon]
MATDFPVDSVCSRCLGRSYAKVGSGFSNIVRGRIVEFVFHILGLDLPDIVEEGSCKICSGSLSDLDRYTLAIAGRVSGYEFSNFLVGSTFDREVLSVEGSFQEVMGGLGESIKKEFNRECGKSLSETLKKEVEFLNPDLTIIVDLRYDSIALQTSSVYISGTYRKTRRDLPQTRWIHGDHPGDSVEEIVGIPLQEMTASENFFLHGAGREDVDVRMLGNGRQFVIEAYHPVKRAVDLDRFRETVNGSGRGVEISNLSFCDVSLIRKIKADTNDKTYRARVEFDSSPGEEKVRSAIEIMAGKIIYQRTPLRVASRRSDLIRERRIISIELEDFHGNLATLIVTAQSGTYIKEMLNGDNGRTEPSLSSLCEMPVRVLELDVIMIHRGENTDKNV